MAEPDQQNVIGTLPIDQPGRIENRFSGVT